MLFPAKITREKRINIPKEVIRQFNISSIEEIYIYVNPKAIKLTKNFMADSDNKVITPDGILSLNRDNRIRISPIFLAQIGKRYTYYVEYMSSCINIY